MKLDRKTKEKLWGGRFTQTMDALVESFTASIHFDKALAMYDILGSMAHANMLHQCNLLNNEEIKKIINGLKNISEKIQNDSVQFSITDEDIHLNIERLLHTEIGDIAGKLHTARSRNDQVALDLHLYLRDHTKWIIEKIYLLQKTIVDKAAQYHEVIMPGYTHLQRAQPIRLAHHLLSYVAMLQRDIERFMDSWKRINVLPLGAGAISGTDLPINREFVAEILGFDAIYENSMDAVSNRDFVIEFIANASLLMMHISRLSEEIILWSTHEFNFIELDDAYCTGSSMMPQKKNPDIAELTRGKTGRIYGALISILTMMKGLPLTYNRDMQEDKENLFDTVSTLHNVLDIYVPMLQSLKFNTEIMWHAVMNDYSNATALANYLAQKNIPFREAHAIVGNIVLDCLKQEKLLQQLSISEYQSYCPAIEKDIYAVIDPKNIVATQNSRGGTGDKAMLLQFREIQKKFAETEAWLGEIKISLENSAQFSC